MTEEIESTIHSSLFAFPLRVRLRGKVVGNLSDRLRKSDRQFTTRVVITKQDIGDGSSALGARKPPFDNSRHVLVNPVDAHRPAVQQYDDRRFTGGENCLHQLQLTTGQIEARARCGLTYSVR